MTRHRLVEAAMAAAICGGLYAGGLQADSPQIAGVGITGGIGGTVIACEVGRTYLGNNPDGSAICSTVTTEIGPTSTDGWPHYYSMHSGPSIVVAPDGRPIVVYAGNNGRNVLHCGNRSCLNGNVLAAAEPVVFGGDFGDYYPSVQLDQAGNPMFARAALDSGALELVRCFSPTCTAATTLRTVRDDDSGSGGSTYLFPSLARRSNGTPLIAYQAFFDWASIATDSRPPNRLMLASCLDADCNAIQHYTMTILGNQGYTPDLKLGADGAPLIVHGTDAGLKVTHCQSPGCFTSGFGSPESVMLTGPFSYAPHENAAWKFAPSLAIGADDLPIISYRAPGRPAHSRLRVTHCGDAACQSGNTSVDIAVPGPSGPTFLTGRFTSMAIGTDGLPVIAHDDGITGALLVTHCSTVTCTGKAITTVVDASPGTAAPAMTIGTDGTPVIAYASAGSSDTSGQVLKIAKCARATCQ